MHALVHRCAAAIAHRPWLALGLYLVTTAALYALATHAPWREPLLITPTALDDRVPFLPGLFPLYLTYVLIAPSLVLLARRRPAFGVLACAAAVCVLGNLFMNLAMPTAVALPPATAENGWHALVLALDTPLAALPSGHVALPAALCCAAVVLEDRSWRLYGAWTLLMAAMALVTKQHYAPDVLAGFAWGAASGTTVAVASLPRTALAVRWRTLAAMLLEFTVNAAVLAWAATRWDAFAIGVAMVVIGSRQHALFILYHDAVHGLVARNRRVNDFVTNLLVGVPQLLPVHVYRALHMAHHRDLGTPRDPERVLLFAGQPWQYRPLPAGALARQLLGDLLLVNGVRTLIAFATRRLQLPPQRAYPELWLTIVAYATPVALGLWLAPQWTAHALILWLVPQLTVLQLLQKLRSFGEHAGDQGANNWQPGWLGRLTVWPYHINYHDEHHRDATLPWYELPRRFLARGAIARPSFARVLWRHS